MTQRNLALQAILKQLICSPALCSGCYTSAWSEHYIAFRQRWPLIQNTNGFYINVSWHYSAQIFCTLTIYFTPYFKPDAVSSKWKTQLKFCLSQEWLQVLSLLEWSGGYNLQVIKSVLHFTTVQPKEVRRGSSSLFWPPSNTGAAFVI